MANQRPNIILIITDQQRYDTIRALGFPYMDTPHLDRLVRQGIAFTNCHVTGPSCAPSRASFFTGNYPHTTGVLRNADVWPRTWVESLAQAGYHCVNIGKMHTWPYHASTGFHQRYVVENKDRYLEGRYYFDEWDKALRARGLIKQQRELYRRWPDYRERLGAFEWELPEDTHPDFFVGDMARWWIQTYPKTEPLFLEIGFPGPHPPYDPIRRYAEPYLRRDLPLPAATELDLKSQPPPFLEMRLHNTQVDHDSIVHLLEPTREQLHRRRAYYSANVTMIDEKIGQIMEALEAADYLKNAIIIFTSDHGDALGDHGHSQKWTMYEAITRIPMIVWSSGLFPGGRTVDALCQHMDLAPALLEVAGAAAPGPMEAESFLPALQGPLWEGRPYVFAEHGRDGILQTTEFMSMVRSQAWKLVHFLNADFGQLFDLAADPGEVQNLWDDPAHTAKKHELLNVLLDWRIRSGCRTQSQRSG